MKQTSPPPAHAPHGAVVDIELTSRCNADCSFCPREQSHSLGLIDDATFTAALQRAVEYRDALLEFGTKHPGHFDLPEQTLWLSFCGMGEPLLHPRIVEYVRRAKEAGLRPIINTNGALLDPGRADELMEAGLSMACINVGEIDDDYEEVYGLPFERTRTNVEQFLAAAGGRCQVVIVLVDHRNDQEHADRMEQYWAARGATAFLPFPLVNRAGALDVGDQRAAQRSYRELAQQALRASGEETHCSVPFLYPFIGYDGNYYLCSSDWRKEVPLGNVFERSLADILDDKVAHVKSQSSICQDCTHDPSNTLAIAMAGAEEDDVQRTLEVEGERLRSLLDQRWASANAMRRDMKTTPAGAGQNNRKRIPVRS
jgi:MoaA/NifB/PqqE/SkfB family radical SAM enzyme